MNYRFLKWLKHEEKNAKAAVTLSHHYRAGRAIRSYGQDGFLQRSKGKVVGSLIEVDAGLAPFIAASEEVGFSKLAIVEGNQKI
jgi:hypothetical protein